MISPVPWTTIWSAAWSWPSSSAAINQIFNRLVDHLWQSTIFALVAWVLALPPVAAGFGEVSCPVLDFCDRRRATSVANGRHRREATAIEPSRKCSATVSGDRDGFGDKVRQFVGWWSAGFDVDSSSLLAVGSTIADQHLGVRCIAAAGKVGAELVAPSSCGACGYADQDVVWSAGIGDSDQH